MGPPWKAMDPASFSATLMVLISAGLWKGSWSQNSDYNLTVPASVSVQRGLCVHIPCSFTYNQRERTSQGKLYGYWFLNKDGYSHRFTHDYYRFSPGILVATNDERQVLQDSVKNRFQLTGEVGEGNCSFSILNAESDYAGDYYFRIEVNMLRYTYTARNHRILEVLVPEFTEEPQIWASSVVLPGKEVVYTCSALGPCVRIAPVISWDTRLRGYGTPQRSQQHTNGSWTYESNFTFTPSLNDEDKWLTCRVRYLHIWKRIEKGIQVDVANPPTTVEISTNATDRGHHVKPNEILGSSPATFLLVILCLIKVLFCFLFFFSVVWFSNRRKAPLK